MRHQCLMKTIRPTTKDALIEAAFELLGKDSTTSLADIAARAGVGRATLHRHFPSRDTLIQTLALCAIEELDEAADEAFEAASSSTQAMRSVLEALVPLGDRYRFLWREPLEDDPKIARELERQKSETQELVQAAQAEGAFDPTFPTSWIVQTYDYLLLAAWESVSSGETTPAQAAELAWRTLETGLKGERP